MYKVHIGDMYKDAVNKSIFFSRKKSKLCYKIVIVLKNDGVVEGYILWRSIKKTVDLNVFFFLKITHPVWQAGIKLICSWKTKIKEQISLLCTLYFFPFKHVIQ